MKIITVLLFITLGANLKSYSESGSILQIKILSATTNIADVLYCVEAISPVIHIEVAQSTAYGDAYICHVSFSAKNLNTRTGISGVRRMTYTFTQNVGQRKKLRAQKSYFADKSVLHGGFWYEIPEVAYPELEGSSTDNEERYFQQQRQNKQTLQEDLQTSARHACLMAYREISDNPCEPLNSR
ncbi:MAG: hypothetical protein ACOYOK_09240 [Pseudobdellovibrionaceae bacterium]